MARSVFFFADWVSSPQWSVGGNRKTMKIVQSDMGKLDLASNQRELEIITKYHSTRFLMTFLAATSMARSVFFFADWVSSPQWSVGGTANCKFNSFAAWVTYCWMIFLALPMAVIISRLWKVPAAKRVARDGAAIVVYVAADLGFAQIPESGTSRFLRLFIGYMLVLGLFYLPIRKERTVIAREIENSKSALSPVLSTRLSSTISPSPPSIGLPLEAELVLQGVAASSNTSRVQLRTSLRKFESFLANEVFFKAFKNFLASEFCVESLLYWNVVNEFRALHQFELGAARLLATKILENYIKPGSIFEINISQQMRTSLLQVNVEAKDFPKEDMFDDTQSEVLNLMYSGAFVRFKRTAEFEQVLAGLDKQGA
eukprot:TRINITY_DN10446_c0_g1_i2.p1 TRINITY_DN10446_c0_g1~~TRINITY_DN10446_c0_g1_i2.p1  ORF type:complete len:371 (+),score=81.81 TRINITY_DN10446_c0_g1_i2:1-1113(+)